MNEQLEQAERFIVQGCFREAGLLLRRVRSTSISRVQVCRLASLLRRTGSYDRALRLLRPIVRPKAALQKSATPHEIAEYAICLQRGGSLEEARELIAGVSPREVPEALLYRAIFLFPDWNYAAAISILRELISQQEKNSYLNQVGRLNLAAALINEEQFYEAKDLLSPLLVDTESAQHRLLHCNALEVSAQLAVFTGAHREAEDFLNKAELLLSGVKTFERLWLMKWRAVLDAIRCRDISRLQTARAEAALKNHWETHRELDFFACKIAYDPQLARKLYYGTPSQYYRARLKRHFEIPETTRIFIGQGFHFHAQARDALHILRDLDDQLSPGDLPHIVFSVLLSDAYRGWRSGQLHSLLFPGEYYNPFTTLDRVHQLMKRTRIEIRKKIPDIRLLQTDGIYRLDLAEFEGTLETVDSLASTHPLDVRLLAMKIRHPKIEFDTNDVQRVLVLSRSAADRLIRTWYESERIVMMPSISRTRRYKFAT